MKVIFVSMDRKLFAPGSAVAKRMIEYGGLFEKLDVIVFTKEGDDAVLSVTEPLVLAPNVTIHPTKSRNRWQYMGNAFAIGRKLGADAAASSGGAFEYVSGDGPETSRAAMRIARAIKAKFHMQLHTDVFSPHFGRGGILNTMRVAMVRQMLPKADSIRVVSKRIADSIIEKKIRTKVAPMILPIFEETDARFLDATSATKPAAFVEGVCNFLTVSRLEPEKDMAFLLDVFAAVRIKYAALHPEKTPPVLVVVGAGSEEMKLKKHAEKLEIREAVKFVGWTDDVASYYKNTDIYLQTSFYEGFGRSLYEAALSGCTIVTTDVGLVGEVLVDGTSAAVIPHDVKKAAEIIVPLVDDESRRRALGSAARSAATAYLMNKQTYLEKFKALFI